MDFRDLPELEKLAAILAAADGFLWNLDYDPKTDLSSEREIYRRKAKVVADHMKKLWSDRMETFAHPFRGQAAWLQAWNAILSDASTQH